MFKDCVCDSYGAPVSYNAPTNSYESPIDDYGAPLAPVYGAPSYEGGCDCKCNRRTFHLGGKEKDKDKDKECKCDCNDGYAAPVSGYGAPSYDYQPPAPAYSAPVDSYGNISLQ